MIQAELLTLLIFDSVLMYPLKSPSSSVCDQGRIFRNFSFSIHVRMPIPAWHKWNAKGKSRFTHILHCCFHVSRSTIFDGPKLIRESWKFSGNESKIVRKISPCRHRRQNIEPWANSQLPSETWRSRSLDDSANEIFALSQYSPCDSSQLLPSCNFSQHRLGTGWFKSSMNDLVIWIYRGHQ